jgi:uncharacterized protein YjbJ (UPF0337 family)
MTATDKSKNSAQIAKGKVKEATGKATGDEHLQDEGKAEQMIGHLKQAGEKVKDAFEAATKD